MQEIQMVMETRKREILLRAWQWPEPTEVLRAFLTSTPAGPRGAMGLLEALALWQGRPVHVAVVAAGRDGYVADRLFPDLCFDPAPSDLVQVSFVTSRPAGPGVGYRPPAPRLRLGQSGLPFAERGCP
jgi:hypothetical protein